MGTGTAGRVSRVANRVGAEPVPIFCLPAGRRYRLGKVASAGLSAGSRPHDRTQRDLPRRRYPALGPCGGPHRRARRGRVLGLDPWGAEWTPEQWRKAVREPDDRDETATLGPNASRGRPLATGRFLGKLEHKRGRRLRPLPVGRPKRAPTTPRRRRKKGRK